MNPREDHLKNKQTSWVVCETTQNTLTQFELTASDAKVSESRSIEAEGPRIVSEAGVGVRDFGSGGVFASPQMHTVHSKINPILLCIETVVLEGLVSLGSSTLCFAASCPAPPFFWGGGF